MDAYSMTYEVRWTDIDANRHVRYSAYIDAAAELRYRFFTDHDLSPEAFDKLGVGPVYTSLTANFFREVRLGETLTITYLLTGLSPQGVRWKVQHDFLKANGKKAVWKAPFLTSLPASQPCPLPRSWRSSSWCRAALTSRSFPKAVGLDPALSPNY
jgi:acyl-CoA thioesterase FadM